MARRMGFVKSSKVKYAIEVEIPAVGGLTWLDVDLSNHLRPATAHADKLVTSGWRCGDKIIPVIRARVTGDKGVEHMAEATGAQRDAAMARNARVLASFEAQM